MYSPIWDAEWDSRGERLVGFNQSLVPRSEEAQNRGQGQISTLKSQKPSSLGSNKLVNGCSVPVGIWRNRSAIPGAVQVLPSLPSSGKKGWTGVNECRGGAGWWWERDGACQHLQRIAGPSGVYRRRRNLLCQRGGSSLDSLSE